MGNLVGGYFIDRIGSPKTLMLSLAGFRLLLIAFSVLTLLNPSTLSIAHVSLIALLWGIPCFGMNPALNSYLISLNTNLASMVFFFSASALYLGIGLGAFIGGGVINISSRLCRLNKWYPCRYCTYDIYCCKKMRKFDNRKS